MSVTAFWKNQARLTWSICVEKSTVSNIFIDNCCCVTGWSAMFSAVTFEHNLE